MADSNVPQHQDRALFGLFGKKKGEEETHQQYPSSAETHQQYPSSAETHQQHPTGVETHGYGHVGTPVSQVHVGDIRPVPPHGSHVHAEEPKYPSSAETHQQHPTGVDQHGYGHVGTPVSQVHVGDIRPVPPHGSHVQAEEPKYHGEGEKNGHEGRMGGNLNRTNSSSSSSSSDEEGEKGEGKKEKKGGLKERLPGHKKRGEAQGEQKEGFMDKIKEKLPGQKKEEQNVGYGRPEEVGGYGRSEEVGEKKGVMDKIKEKIPGQHKKEERGQY